MLVMCSFSCFTTIFSFPDEGTTDTEVGSTPVRLTRPIPEYGLSVDVMNGDQKSVNEHMVLAHAARSDDALTPDLTHRISREFGRQMGRIGGFRASYFQSKPPLDQVNSVIRRDPRSVGRDADSAGSSSDSTNTNSTISPLGFRTRACRRGMVHASVSAHR